MSPRPNELTGQSEPNRLSFGVASQVEAARTEPHEAEEVGQQADGEQDGVFGPNSSVVFEFLRRLHGLSRKQQIDLILAWRAQPAEPLHYAHVALQKLANEDAGWRAQILEAQANVDEWIREGGGREPLRVSRTIAGVNATRGIREVGVGLIDHPEQIQLVLTDAVSALAMADLLERPDAETLYAPWASVIGEPQLPTYEN